MGLYAGRVPLWFLQVIYAAPFRNNPATPDVYAAGLVLFTFLLLPLALSRVPRLRGAAIVASAGALLVGLLYTYSRLPTAGTLWQGRYSWCVALGVLLLAGLALEHRPIRVLEVLSLAFAVPSLILMHLRSLQALMGYELEHSPLSEDPSWVTAPTAVVLAIACLGLLSWGIGARLATGGYAATNEKVDDNTR